MDRYLLSGAVALLIVEIALLLGDLGVIPFDPFHLNNSSLPQQKIGSVIYVNQNVRRKGKGSLIWENSSTKDSLYAFDSILTLSNSSVKVELDGKIKLNLHENTLVVLEPMEKSKNDHLRLKFARGNLRTQSGQNHLDIQTQEMVVEAKSGSDLNLRSVGDDQVELEVTQGEVKLNNKNAQTEQLTAGHKVVLDQGKVIERKEISKDLAWDMLKNEFRIYAHRLPVFFSLKWKGNADQIRLSRSGKQNEHSKISLIKQQQELMIPLEYGTYFFTLLKTSESVESVESSSYTVQVWPAEKIFYLSPLPRDRVDQQVGEMFSWSESHQAVRYHLQISNTIEFNQILFEKVGNTQQMAVRTQEFGPLYWRVVGEDEVGTLIPAQYGQLFYSVLEPLAAPLLNQPQLRGLASPSGNLVKEKKSNLKQDDKGYKEKSKRTKNMKSHQKEAKLNVFKKWLSDGIVTLLGNLAQAQELPLVSEQKPMLLSWQPVAGADYYIIEISETEDFQFPVIIQKVNTEQFIWKPPSKKVHYWRVAAGQNSGRMGLFSMFAEVDPTIQTKEVHSENEEESEKKMPPPKETSFQAKSTQSDSLIKNLNSLAPLPSSPEKIVVPKLEKYEKSFSFQFGFSPQYIFWHQTKQESLDVLMSGWSSVSMESSINIPLSEKGRVLLQGQFHSWRWEPKNSTDWPFQKKFTHSEGDFYLLFQPQGSHWITGVWTHHGGYLERSGVESLKWKNKDAYGGLLGYFRTVGKRGRWWTDAGIAMGSDYAVSVVESRYDYFVSVFGSQLYGGGKIQSLYESNQHSLNQLSGSALLHLGFEW